MASAAFSQSSSLHIAANVFATIFVGFGINAIIRPTNALTFFEFQPPTLPTDKKMVDSLMAVYGVRDIFMGLAIYAAALYGDRKTLGLILISGSAVAFVDGAVCYSHGKGEWGHWSYAPFLTVLGSLLLGVLDRA